MRGGEMGKKRNRKRRRKKSGDAEVQNAVARKTDGWARFCTAVATAAGLDDLDALSSIEQVSLWPHLAAALVQPGPVPEPHPVQPKTGGPSLYL